MRGDARSADSRRLVLQREHCEMRVEEELNGPNASDRRIIRTLCVCDAPEKLPIKYKEALRYGRARRST